MNLGSIANPGVTRRSRAIALTLAMLCRMMACLVKMQMALTSHNHNNPNKGEWSTCTDMRHVLQDDGTFGEDADGAICNKQ